MSNGLGVLEQNKITFKKHWSLVFPGLIILVGYMVISIYFQTKVSPEIAEDINFWIIISLAVVLFPHLLLHINYWLVNRNLQFSAMDYGIELTLNSQKFELDADFVKRIDIYLPTSQYFKGLRTIPTENYYFAKVTTTNNNVFKITNLLDEELFWLKRLKPQVQVRHWRFICFTY